MELVVRLSDEEVAVLDAYVRSTGLRSRAAALKHVIGLLRHPDLEEHYAAAWDSWVSAGEQAAWDSTSADGLPRASR